MTRVLLVGDPTDRFGPLRDALSRAGALVETAARGGDALAMARRLVPDVVAGDVLAPAPDGDCLVQRWKADAALAPIPFVAFAAPASLDEQLARDLGADDVVPPDADAGEAARRLLAASERHRGGGPRRPHVDESAARRVYTQALARRLEEREAELRQDRQRAAAREAHLRTIIDTEPECVKLVGPGGRLIDMNPAGLRMIEADSLADVRDRNIVDLVAEEDRPAFVELSARVFRGESGSLEFRVRGLRGGERWLETHATPLRNGDGRIEALLGITRDVTRRREAERRLEESERRFRSLIEHAPEAIVLLDTSTGRFLDANPAAERLFGLPADRLRQLGPVDLSPPTQPDGRASRDAAAGYVERARRGETPAFEWTHLDGGGQPIACEVRLLRLELGGHEVLRGSIVDISARKAAEERLRLANRTLAMLMEIGQLIARDRDAQAVLDGACDIAVRRGGFSLAWVGLAPSDGPLRIAAHAGADPATVALIAEVMAGPGCAFTERAMAGGEPEACNDIARDPRSAPWRAAALARGLQSMIALPLIVDGRRIGTLNLYADRPGFFDEHEVQLLGGLAEDVAFALKTRELEERQRRAEAEVRAHEERFRLLIENTSDVIMMVDADGIVRYQSPSLTTVLGYAPEELLGRSLFDLVHPDDAAATRESLATAVTRPGGSVSVEHRVRHRNGEWRILQSLGRLLPEHGGGDQLVVVNARDLTDTRRLEEQLRQSQKMEAIGQLAGGVAHDFNNILVAILLQAELADGEPDLPEEARARLRQVREAANRAADLTRQLLLFSRRQVMQPRDLDVNQVIANTATMLRRIIGEDVQLHLHLDPGPLVTRADAGMLEQVLLNLAVNGRDAMPGGGVLRIATGRSHVPGSDVEAPADAAPGPYVRISVSDTGHGIPADVRPHIFEPFFTTKGPGKGTGLGLATVFGIVRQHKGWIVVRSEPGHGAAFDVHLPLSDNPSPEPPPPASSLAATGSETILLVEDEPEVRTVTRLALERVGYRILEAGDAAEARRVWRAHQRDIALLLTDLVMPGGTTGQQLAAELCAERPALKVVYFSGYSPNLAGRELALGSGHRFLQKPFSAADLRQLVRQYLDEP
ncbi:MAG: PAS domain S-box protein [Acidobacteriota bacterium]